MKKTEKELLLCPPCKKGDHKHHVHDFWHRDFGVTLCQCPECKV